MTHPTLEKVARAICEDGYHGHGNSRRWDRITETARDGYLGEARAAIAAMREPTQSMIRIVEVTSDTHRMICPTIGWECAMKIWQAMIDHILKGEG